MKIGGEEMGGLEACRRDELTGVGRPVAGERAVDATDGERTKGEEHVGAGEAGRYIILSRSAGRHACEPNVNIITWPRPISAPISLGRPPSECG